MIFKTPYIIYVTYLWVFLQHHSSGQETLPCGLTWVETSRGIALPTKAVNSDEGTQLVAKARIPGRSASSLGRVTTEQGNGYFPYSSQQYNLTSYEILTNPYDCILAWLPWNHDYSTRYPVAWSNQIVGRAYLKDKDIMASGYISNRILFVADGGRVHQFGQNDYAVLTSISKGLEMTVNSFKFDSIPESKSTEMVGKDEIVNDSGATAYQTITHKKDLNEETRLTSSFSWNIAPFITINFCISVACQKLSIKYSTSSSTLQVTQNKEISFSRTIEVPPYSSVEVCSIIEKADAFTSTWNAFIEFKCAGKSADEVINELKRNPSWAGKSFEIFGNTAVTSITGSYSGNFMMSSKFFVGDIGSGLCS